jgi:hypothetical protein
MFAALDAGKRRRVRKEIINMLSRPDSTLFTDLTLNNEAFFRRVDVDMHMPMAITDYSDSSGSLIHAENVGLFPFVEARLSLIHHANVLIVL